MIFKMTFKMIFKMIFNRILKAHKVCAGPRSSTGQCMRPRGTDLLLELLPGCFVGTRFAHPRVGSASGSSGVAWHVPSAATSADSEVAAAVPVNLHGLGRHGVAFHPGPCGSRQPRAGPGPFFLESMFIDQATHNGTRLDSPVGVDPA